MLSTVSAFDYLTLGHDPTAVRLISPQIRTFVEEDLTADSTYIDTLIAYVECDLNAKATAERVQLHVNTVYYHLERIGERTGCDLRRFGEVTDLLVAIRLLSTGAPGRQD